MIPDLTEIIPPAQRQKLYTIWAVGAAIIAVTTITLASGGLVNPMWLLMVNVAWNAGGSACGFIAKDNTPTPTPTPDEESV